MPINDYTALRVNALQNRHLREYLDLESNLFINRETVILYHVELEILATRPLIRDYDDIIRKLPRVPGLLLQLAIVTKKNDTWMYSIFEYHRENTLLTEDYYISRYSDYNVRYHTYSYDTDSTLIRVNRNDNRLRNTIIVNIVDDIIHSDIYNYYSIKTDNDPLIMVSLL